MPLEERGGFPVFWQTQGLEPVPGGRECLLIHCTLGNSRAWQGVVNGLEDRAKLDSFDLPGHGKSADWDGQGDYQTTCTNIARDFLQCPADLIGHSFGATVALRLAVEHPELVRSLTLIEPVYFAILKGRAALAQQKADFAPFVQAMMAGDAEGATREFTREWGDGTPWDQIPERQKLSAIKRIHLVAAHRSAIYDDAAGVLDVGRLEQLTIPVLLLEGAMSPSVIAAIQEQLAARLPNVRRQIVPGARHMLPVTHAGEVSSHIRAFWDEVRAS